MAVVTQSAYPRPRVWCWQGGVGDFMVYSSPLWLHVAEGFAAQTALEARLDVLLEAAACTEERQEEERVSSH